MFPKNTLQVVLFLTILLALNKTGSALKCYICLSEPSGGCGDAFDAKKTLSIPCTGADDACLKNVYTNMITRRCGNAAECKDKDNCYTCNTELCNSSSILGPSFIFTSLVTFMVTKFFL